MADIAVATRVGSRGRLPTGVRLLLTSDVITAVGMGLTQPYLLILLHSTYALSLATAAATTSLSAVVSLAGNPLSGTLTDRYGGRITMLAGLASVTAGLVTIASGGTVMAAAAGVALTGFGWSLVLPAFATLIASSFGESRRSSVFTLQYALYNAGMGVGAALGGAVVAHHRSDLPVLWLLAAGTCAASGAVVATLGGPVRTAAGPQERPQQHTGYRQILSDRPLWRILTVTVALSAAGYGVYAVGPSVVAVTENDPAALSWVGTANCAVVVLGLPVALRLGRQLMPYPALRAAAGTWGAAWVLCIAQMTGFGPGPRISLPLAAALVGAGELLMASALPSLVNALAPDALRGRYNALLTIAMTMGVWGGPALASITSYLGHGALLFVAALAILAGAGALLRRPAIVVHQ
jgi:MFS family permease